MINKEELGSKIRHKIQNQLGMVMLLMGTEKLEKEKIITILKRISVLVEILGQLEKNQKRVEWEEGGKQMRMKPIEVEVEKLTLSGANWPEIEEIRQYFGLAAGVTKTPKGAD